MSENKLADLSMDFAVELLKLCDNIKGHYSIVNQLERSATSIGPISERQNMLIANRTLYQNFKYL